MKSVIELTVVEKRNYDSRGNRESKKLFIYDDKRTNRINLTITPGSGSFRHVTEAKLLRNESSNSGGAKKLFVEG